MITTASADLDAFTDLGPVEVLGGPHTIAAPGETCLLCDNPLEPGSAYVFVLLPDGPGVAHEADLDVVVVVG